MKANQSNLFETARAIAANDAPADTAFSRGKGRSRQEDRTVEVFPVGDALAGTAWQPFIKTIILHDDDDETTVLEFDESGAAV